MTAKERRIIIIKMKLRELNSQLRKLEGRTTPHGRKLLAYREKIRPHIAAEWRIFVKGWLKRHGYNTEWLARKAKVNYFSLKAYLKPNGLKVPVVVVKAVHKVLNYYSELYLKKISNDGR